MTTKGLLRYAIAVVVLAILCSIVLPRVGIPHSAIVPPPIDYAQAASTTTGYVTDRDQAPTTNLFHVGDVNNFVWYQYRAPAIPSFGQHTIIPPGQTAVYKGHAQVDKSFYDDVKVGQTVPVKYDPADPVISGITAPGAGRNVAGAASLLGLWIVWDLGILIVAYPVAMFLERLFLRESY